MSGGATTSAPTGDPGGSAPPVAPSRAAAKDVKVSGLARTEHRWQATALKALGDKAPEKPDTAADRLTQVVEDHFNKQQGRELQTKRRGLAAAASKWSFLSLSKGPEKPLPAIIYDPKASFRNLFAWKGTAVKLVFHKLDFWVLLGLNVIFTLTYHYGTDEPEDLSTSDKWPSITQQTLLVVGGFITFFMVFFNAEAYQRFFNEYFIACRIRYSVNDVFFLSRVHMDDPRKMVHVLRLCHAGQYLGFFNLPNNREIPGFLEGGFNRLVEMGVLHKDEVSYLKSIENGNPSTDTLVWAMRILRNEMNTGNMKPPIYRAFESKVMGIRDHFDDLLAYSHQPIPFAYYHLMNVVCECYLLVLAYIGIGVTPPYAIAGYFITLLALLGLREAAACLADPMGLDESDIPVFDMVRDAHFEHQYQLARMRNDCTEKLIEKYGSNANLEEIKFGIDPSVYGLETPLSDTMTDTDLLRAAQHSHFWMELTTGSSRRADKKHERYLESIARAKAEEGGGEPPAAAEEDPDDDDFESDLG